MNDHWLVTFRSVTFAQKAEQVLKGAGIRCAMQRTPKELSKRGCGYCLRIRGADVLAAVGLLQEKQAPYEKIYALTERGRPEEREL